MFSPASYSRSRCPSVVSCFTCSWRESLYFRDSWPNPDDNSLIIHKTNNTLYAMVAYTLINATGTIVLCTVAPSESTRIGLFIAFILMQSFSAINTAMFLMMSRNIAGQTKKSLVYGSTFMAWGAGNAIAPQLFWDSWAPRYLPSLYIHLGIYTAFATLCLVTRVLLVRRNKDRDIAQQHLDGQNRNLHVSRRLSSTGHTDHPGVRRFDRS